jgi:hypothetical protein
MSIRIKSMIMLLAGVFGYGCSSIGPHPEIIANKSEIQRTKQFDSILVFPTSGTGSTDLNSKLNLSVPGGAFRRYQDNLILQAGIIRTVKTLKMPEGTSDVLPVAWQIAFYKWIKKFKKSPKNKKRRLSLVPPNRPKKLLSRKGVRKLSKTLGKSSKGITRLALAAKEADMEKLEKAVSASKRLTRKLESLNSHLYRRLGITYLLLSHFDGDIERFKANTPIHLYVAMINPLSGKFRYFAVNTMLKEDVPTTFEGMVDIGSINIFDDAADFDELEID